MHIPVQYGQVGVNMATFPLGNLPELCGWALDESVPTIQKWPFAGPQLALILWLLFQGILYHTCCVRE